MGTKSQTSEDSKMNANNGNSPPNFGDIGSSYEPIVVKKQHTEPMPKTILKMNPLNYSNDKVSELNQNPLLALEMLAQNTGSMSSLAQNMTASSMMPPSANQESGSTANGGTSKYASGNDDQAALLKKINKILDENTVLKKHLEICQKIIGIYQSNMSMSNNPNNNAINMNGLNVPNSLH